MPIYHHFFIKLVPLFSSKPTVHLSLLQDFVHNQKYPSYSGTVWKFQDFCNTEILREINFGNSRSAKFAILIQLESLNFCTFLKLIFTYIIEFRAPKIVKMAVLQLLEFPKLISRKI